MINANSTERRYYILKNVYETKKFPVRTIMNEFKDDVSIVTINKDMQLLENNGLIRRQKDFATAKSYALPTKSKLAITKKMVAKLEYDPSI